MNMHMQNAYAECICILNADAGGVVGMEDVITSLFLKPTVCRSAETRIARGGN